MKTIAKPASHHVLNMCYTSEMRESFDTVSVRELRINTSAVLRRIEAGERLVVTVDGRPVAELVPRAMRTTWVPKERAVAGLVQADPRLAAELKELQTETTDDVWEKVERRYAGDS